MVPSLIEEISERVPLFARAGKTYVLHLPEEDGTKKRVEMDADSELFRDFANLCWIGGGKSPLTMLREMGHKI